MVPFGQLGTRNSGSSNPRFGTKSQESGLDPWDPAPITANFKPILGTWHCQVPRMGVNLKLNWARLPDSRPEAWDLVPKAQLEDPECQVSCRHSGKAHSDGRVVTSLVLAV